MAHTHTHSLAGIRKIRRREARREATSHTGLISMNPTKQLIFSEMHAVQSRRRRLALRNQPRESRGLDLTSFVSTLRR